MEISGMLIWAMVLVSLIVFIVLLVKAFQSWGVTHTILLTILFLECWTFLFFAAGVAHHRIAITKQHDEIVAKVEQQLKSVDLEMFGDRLDPKLDLTKFVPLTNELNRLTLERGRVWRGAALQRATPASGKTPSTVILQLPGRVSNLPVGAPDGAAGAAGAEAVGVAPAADSGLALESVVYLFGEKQQQVGLLPEFFLGEFVVKEAKDQLITVSPTFPLTKDQETAISGYVSWALYEVMPLDSHSVFAADGSSPEETAVYGRMDKEDITRIFESAFAGSIPPLTEEMKARILDTYFRDGGPASEDTPPELLGYQVKFRKDFTEGVDAKGLRLPLEGGYYDTEGNMIDDRLKRDAPADITFKVDDSYVLDSGSANKLQSNGTVELGSRIFIRQLIDYAFAFRETRRVTIRAQQDTALIARETEQTIAQTLVTDTQEQRGEAENRMLKLDQGQYEKEAEVIASVAKDLEAQIAAKKAELSQLYGSIVAYRDRLVKHQRDLASVSNAAALTASP
jgi:hypothetical protein